MDPLQFFKCLADETRLKCVLLIDSEHELCVCDLAEAIGVSQPKVSRHLANLRNCDILTTRKKDQWVYYSINPEIIGWTKLTITQTRMSNPQFIKTCVERLNAIKNRSVRC